MKNFNQEFRDRTKKNSISIIKSLAPLPYSDDLSIIRKVTRARSEKEKYAKVCIVVEEADETQFWLEIIEELEYLSIENIQILKNETDEIVKVMTTYKKKLLEIL